MSSNDKSVSRFMELTGSNSTDAKTYLWIAENKLPEAVDLYFNAANDSSVQQSSKIDDFSYQNAYQDDQEDEDGYRKAIPVKKMRLIGEESKNNCCEHYLIISHNPLAGFARF